jgi:hypothetical protein
MFGTAENVHDVYLSRNIGDSAINLFAQNLVRIWIVHGYGYDLVSNPLRIFGNEVCRPVGL